MPENKKSPFALLVDGIWGNNPLLRLALGICPALAVATTGINGLAIGLATAAVLVCSNLVISLIKGLISGPFRLPVIMVIIAGFAAGAQMVLKTYFPEINAALSVFVPLIAVNAMLLVRADTFAAEAGPVEALADGIGMGIGYACAMALLGVIREIFAYGSAFGKVIFTTGFEANAMALLPAGGFLLLGLLMGAFNLALGKRTDGKEDANT